MSSRIVGSNKLDIFEVLISPREHTKITLTFSTIGPSRRVKRQREDSIRKWEQDYAQYGMTTTVDDLGCCTQAEERVNESASTPQSSDIGEEAGLEIAVREIRVLDSKRRRRRESTEVRVVDPPSTIISEVPCNQVS